VRVPFGVAYGTDKELVRTAVLAAADRVKFTVKDDPKRGPQVWFVKFGDSSLNFELVVWIGPDAVKRPSAVQAAYLWEIHTALYSNQIVIPFPQNDLHLRSFFGMPDAEAKRWFEERFRPVAQNQEEKNPPLQPEQRPPPRGE
jgi:small-conductance mechanosensitive channel